MIAWDIETNGREFTDPAFRIVMIAADDGTKLRVWDRENVPAAVTLLGKFPQLVGHNASAFDRVALQTKFDVNYRTHDTQLAAYLLDEEAGQRGTHGLRLEALAIKYLGVEGWKDAVTWDWKDIDDWRDDDERWDTMRTYCARDTRYTHRLWGVLRDRLHLDGLVPVYERLLLPASRALAALGQTGVYVNAENVATATEHFTAQRTLALAALQARGLKNPGSTKQLGAFLFDGCGLTPTHWTDGGKPATHELALKTIKHSGQHAEVVDELLAYRQASKMISTYLLPYSIAARESFDGRVHPSYSLTFTVTGRTSAFTPNIQNVPRDKRVRSIIGAAPGNVLLQADLSQAELRIAAFAAGERNMLAAFAGGDDLHYLMAERITGKPRAEITDTERTYAKIANFSLLYGAETGTFVDMAFKDYDVKFGWAEADNIRDSFHAMWPGLWPWYERVYAELMEFEYVTSATGRRRRFPDFRRWTDYHKTDALKQAVNFKVQSLASDIALVALVLVVGMGYKATAYIHDAVQIEIAPDKAEAAGRTIKAAIERDVPVLMAERFGVDLCVPIVADVSIGTDWGHLNKLKP